MLWRATKDGKVMYLFGTLHVGIDVTRRLPLWIWKAFDTATVLVQEVDIHAYAVSQWGNPPMQETSLRAALGEARWEKLVDAVPPATRMVLDKAPPFSVYLTLSGRGSRVKDSDAIPMDADFLVRAKEQSKQLVFLETIDEHGTLIQSLYGLPELETLIDNSDELPGVNRGYFDLYLDGERDRFYERSLASFRLGSRDEAAFQQHVDRLLFARNRAWVSKLEAAHAAHPSGAVFVTVGALHLLGPQSVQSLLAQRGFTIELARAP